MEFPEYVSMVGVDDLWGTVTETCPTGVFHVEWSDGDETDERLHREGENWTRFLSRAVVMECRDIVRAWTRDDTATAYDPGHEGPYWVISLEGGPDNWPYQISETVQWPAGVWVEPVNHFALGLHVKN